MTHKSRTDRRRVFKLGGNWQCWPRDPPCTATVQGQKIKDQGHKVTWRISRQKRSNSAVYGHNNAKSPKVCTIIGNRGRRIERRYQNLHLKCINNRCCACAVQMLLTVAGSATKCSTFEVQYGKSTSTRTTAIRHYRTTLTERLILRMRTN